MPRIIFAASEEEKELWVRAAHRELVTLSEWLRRAAADRVGNGGLAAGEDQRPGERRDPMPGGRRGVASTPDRPPAASPPFKPDFKKEGK